MRKVKAKVLRENGTIFKDLSLHEISEDRPNESLMVRYLEQDEHPVHMVLLFLVAPFKKYFY